MVDLLGERPRERLRRCGIHVGQEAVEGAGCVLERLDLSDLDLMTIGDLMRYVPAPADASLLAMLGLMFAALSEGSLCLRLDREQLQEQVPPGVVPDMIALVDGFMRRLDDGRYDGLVRRPGNRDFRPMVLDETTGCRLLYFQKFHFHERRLKQRLESFSALPGACPLSHDAIQTVIDGLYCDGAVIRQGAGGVPIIRDSYQVEAIRAALTAPLLVVSGGPGTGKTSLLVNMLRALVRCGTDPSRIVLAAPTGRAAHRMSEALLSNLGTIADPDPMDRQLERLGGSTLHKLLVYRSRNAGFLHNRHRPLEADVIAVDEVSMVDVVMMDRLFQAIDPTRTRVILIGDKDQLPSVEAGSVLADLGPSAQRRFVSRFVVLRHGYRSAGRLLELAQAINAGQPVAVKPGDFADALTMQGGDWVFVTAGEHGMTDRHLDQWINHCYLTPRGTASDSFVNLVHAVNRSAAAAESGDPPESMRLFDALFNVASGCRILTVLRHGRRGAVWINQRIAMGLRPHLDPGSSPDSRLFNGALIMITRNDYTRGLYNGDLGLVLRDPGDGMYRAYFKRAEGAVAFPAAGLPDWDLAFALTVHKSQGTEFEDTLLLLPDDPLHRLLTREIVYTAATRASRRLIVYGTKQAFLTSLRRKIHRQSGLMA